MRTIYNLCAIVTRRPDAVAFLNGSEKYKEIRGQVFFYELSDSVIVRAEVNGLPKGNGNCDNPIFAFHIHEGTRCSGTPRDPFANAGMHYNPDNCQHPYHARDMPPLFGVDGSAVLLFLTNRFSVREIIGRTVIIHAKPDDFMTQPSGNSGEKIACGVIRRTAW